MVAWVNREDDLHAVTALSGSGPAYCFLFLQALSQQGSNESGNPDLRGAGKLAANSMDSPTF